MNEEKGCLYWLAAAVLWFILWGLCMSVGDTYSINPLTILFLIIVSTLIIVALGIGIFAYSYNKIYNKHWQRVKEIRDKYYLAYIKYLYDYQIKYDKETGQVHDMSELKKILGRDNKLWEQEENILKEEKEKRDKEIKIKREESKKIAERIKENFPDGLAEWKKLNGINWLFPELHNDTICKAEKDIKILDQKVKFERWENKQTEFNNISIKFAKKFLPKFGGYNYSIPFVRTDLEGNDVKGSYKVWQLFYRGIYIEDIDNHYLPQSKGKKNPCSFFERKLHSGNPDAYNNIAKFIWKIGDYYNNNQNFKISVLFNYDKDWDKEFLDSHYEPLMKLFQGVYNGLITYDSTLVFDFFESSAIQENLNLFEDIIVIFDIATENIELKNLCKKIISLDNNAYPVFLYISLNKIYDNKEMSDFIENDKWGQAKIIDAVSSWGTLKGGIRYSYLLDYYPTTCDFEATDEEWDNRRIIWNFKNTPGKTSTSKHKETLEIVIPLLKEKLLSTFDRDSLKLLTLVCIPASSQVKTKSRYEEFSERFCKETEMINAYPYIKVKEDKEERRAGGTSIDTNKLSFDNDFFNGKYILLFDDVITRGDSMRTFKKKMEKLGATVIGGLSIGKTRHERPNTVQVSQNPLINSSYPIIIYN